MIVLPDDTLFGEDVKTRIKEKLLSDADRALGRLDGVATVLPNPDLFVAMFVRQEAVPSSQIEGAQSTLQDILAYEAQAEHETQPGDVEEVVNYVAAMIHGLRRLPDLPLSLRLMKEIHEKLLHGVRGSEWSPGDLRTSQNWIGPQRCTLANADFVPPPTRTSCWTTCSRNRPSRSIRRKT